MEFNSETLLLCGVLGMYLFCYFLITWVWIKSDKTNDDRSSTENNQS